ncbi:MAG TPA: FHA domain-containing protein [Pyrinomonadaceae bacterium]|nr:FHA domain-containing protein [Pyrinomonadaceae bacterium]
MITCERCQTENLDGSQYCDECGAQLSPSPRAGRAEARGGDSSAGRDPSAAAPPHVSARGEGAGGNSSAPRGFVERRASAMHNDSPSTPTTMPQHGRAAATVAGRQESSDKQSAPPQRETPGGAATSSSPGGNAQGGASAASIGEASGPLQSGAHSLSSGSTGAVVAHAKLVIHRGRSVGKEFPLSEDEAHIGRWDADGGIFPDVDLDSDDPEAKVSRRHARITRRAGLYYIEDLGSTNGTFINRGRRLLPGDRQPLRDGDEVIVGKTFLRFHVIK